MVWGYQLAVSIQERQPINKHVVAWEGGVLMAYQGINSFVPRFTVLHFLSDFVHRSKSRFKICKQRIFAGYDLDASYGKADTRSYCACLFSSQVGQRLNGLLTVD